MNTFKFSGKDKKEAARKALAFYYDNFKDEMSILSFLKKCRFNPKHGVLYFHLKG